MYKKRRHLLQCISKTFFISSVPIACNRAPYIFPKKYPSDDFRKHRISKNVAYTPYPLNARVLCIDGRTTAPRIHNQIQQSIKLSIQAQGVFVYA
ncbi:hypothetical protein SDC9_107257 [bioreactor metagenome]|uniref:Uncharacterized protein n=1 Tax=bioreactor metagenome TaxID=1076179 RepID=A0A645B5S5_9ZZZZ